VEKNQPVNLSSQKPKAYIFQNILSERELNFLPDECNLKENIFEKNREENKKKGIMSNENEECEREQAGTEGGRPNSLFTGWPDFVEVRVAESGNHGVVRHRCIKAGNIEAPLRRPHP
jgi:hypothetical protein